MTFDIAEDMPRVITAGFFPGRPSALTGDLEIPEQGTIATGWRDIDDRTFADDKQEIGAIIQTGGTTVFRFSQFLAKIAHAFAVFELGRASFNPVLSPIILQENNKLTGHFVRALPEQSHYSPDALHMLRLKREQRQFYRLPGLPASNVILIVAEIDLLLEWQLPTFTVVVGHQ